MAQILLAQKRRIRRPGELESRESPASNSISSKKYRKKTWISLPDRRRSSRVRRARILFRVLAGRRAHRDDPQRRFGARGPRGRRPGDDPYGRPHRLRRPVAHVVPLRQGGSDPARFRSQHFGPINKPGQIPARRKY